MSSPERGHIVPDPIFKGCTRPAMLGGVPMLPMVVVTLASFLVGMWGLVLSQKLWIPAIVGAIWLGLFFTMRGIARKDDQRFRQIFLWIMLRMRNSSKIFWRVTSYSPYRFKRR